MSQGRIQGGGRTRSFKKYISYRPILDSSSAMTLIMYILRSIGADPGFQVRGAHLKNLRRAEGGSNIFGVFRVKNHDFTPKNNIFSNFMGGGGTGCAPWIHPWGINSETY
jgi:hypothetical protein